MPELPEVETTCRGIKPFIEGKVISHVIIREARLRWPVPKKLTTLANENNLFILQVKRRGKYILVTTSLGTLIMHLGMSGRLALLSQDKKPGKHDHVDFVLNNGQRLRYTDPRRFGAILWTENDPLSHELLSKLGPEPLEKHFNPSYFFKKALESRQTVKEFIMNSKVVVGVGNIYANEALFAAHILPDRQAKSLTMADCTRLVGKIQLILRNAVKKGGTTLRDFLAPEGKPGYFAQHLFVYGREGERCHCCQKPLIGKRLGQRSTVYCSHCQR